MAIAAAGGSSWTDTWSTVGTLAAVIVAVVVAIATDLRAQKRLRDERAYGRAQLEEERQLAQEREQLAQAYAVQVVPGQAYVRSTESDEYGDPVPPEIRQLGVMVVNRSPYTITRIEAQLCLSSNSLQPYHRQQRMSGLSSVPPEVRGSFRLSAEPSLSSVLTPFDEGIRLETDEIHQRHLSSPYPIVRWKDHWGSFWEHKRGVVRQVSDGQAWEP